MLSHEELDFGTVHPNAPKVLELTITNPTTADVDWKIFGVGTALKGFDGGGGWKPDAPRRALGNASNRSWIQVEHLQTGEGPNLGRRDVRELELVLFFTSYEQIQLALLLQDHWHCDSSGRKLDFDRWTTALAARRRGGERPQGLHHCWGPKLQTSRSNDAQSPSAAVLRAWM